MRKIVTVVKAPGEKAEVRLIEPKLKEFQRLVGGNIEGTYIDEYMDEHTIITYLHSESKLIGLRRNILAFDCRNVIVGTCVFVKGDDNGNDVSLEGDEIAHIMKYCEENDVSDGISITQLRKLMG